MPTTSPNMGLTVPIPSTGVTGTGDAGPGYAVNITADLVLIDAHDHSSGKGVQVTPAGLNINADLNINNNNLTNVVTTKYTSQSSAPSLAIQVTFVLNGELYYINNNGILTKLTQNGQLAPIFAPSGTLSASGIMTASGIPFTLAGNSLVATTGMSPNANQVTLNTISASNYWQAQPTGWTGCVVGMTGGANAGVPTGGGPVQFSSVNSTGMPGNNSMAFSQATSSGTGCTQIQVNQQGLYEISYGIQATGFVQTGATVWQVQQALNATGSFAQGTAIAASFRLMNNNVRAVNGASANYLVAIGAGALLSTWIMPFTNANGGVAGATGLTLSATGTWLTIQQVG